MADNNLDPDDIRKLNEGLRDLSDAISSQTAIFQTSTTTVGAFNSSLKAVNKQLQNTSQGFRKTTQDFSSEMKKMGGAFTKTSKDFTNAKKDEMKALDTIKARFGDVAKGTGNFASNLAKGEASFTALNPIVDLVAESLGSIAKMLPIIGDGIASGIKALASGSKFIIEQIQSAVKIFQDISNTGGLVSDGMSGLGRQLLESGMTVDGFRKVIRESSVDLASLGGTVGLGMEKFSKAVGMLTLGKGPLAEASMGLRKLGLTADQIGEQTAAYLQQEIRLGRAQNMNQEQLAKGTVNYIKELDLLQKVTGLSREDVQKQRDALMTDSRYRAARDQMIADGQEEGAKALDAFILNVKDPELRRGLMDLASGAGNTEAAAKAMRTFGTTVPEIIENLKGATSKEQAAKIFDESNKTLQEAAKESSERLRTAMSLGAEGFISAATQSDLAAGKFVTSMEKAIEIQNKQIKSTDELTANAVSAQQQMEKLSNNLRDLSFTLMKDAAPAVDSFTKAMLDAVNRIKNIIGSSGDMPTWQGATTEGGAATGNPNITRQGNRMRNKSGTSKAEDLLKFGSGTGSREHYNKLDPDVRKNFEAMITEFGQPVQISSAFRSHSEQANVNSGGRPKALPGQSKHNVGRAIDLNEMQVKQLQQSGLLEKYGFTTIPNDPVHIEMAKNAAKAAATVATPPTAQTEESVSLLKAMVDKLENIANSMKTNNDYQSEYLKFYRF